MILADSVLQVIWNDVFQVIQIYSVFQVILIDSVSEIQEMIMI